MYIALSEIQEIFVHQLKMLASSGRWTFPIFAVKEIRVSKRASESPHIGSPLPRIVKIRAAIDSGEETPFQLPYTQVHFGLATDSSAGAHPLGSPPDRRIEYKVATVRLVAASALCGKV